MVNRDIVAIGSSMGGIEALSALVRQLPEDLPAAVFIVQHVAPDSRSQLAEILDKRGVLPAVTAEDGMPIERGHVYVAPPDRHLLLTRDRVSTVRGPRENRSRPAIDPLLRSAAVTYRSRVIGVILTGLLNDGAAGLLAVKRCGGSAVVQAPGDAAYPQMPMEALTAVEDAYAAPLEELGGIITQLAFEPAPDAPPVPEDLLLEARFLERALADNHEPLPPGEASQFSCPECNGTLWELQGDTLRRFRCHVGHAFSAHALLHNQDEDVEEALWVAIRTLEERSSLLERMARDEQRHGRTRMANTYLDRARESYEQARKIRQVFGTGTEASSLQTA